MASLSVGLRREQLDVPQVRLSVERGIRPLGFHRGNSGSLVYSDCFHLIELVVVVVVYDAAAAAAASDVPLVVDCVFLLLLLLLLLLF